MVEKLLNTARAELSAKESPQSSNEAEYNGWHYGRHVSGADYAWCSVFVTWVFYTAGLLTLAWGTLTDARKAVAEGARNWMVIAKKTWQWITVGYKPGDVVVFG